MSSHISEHYEEINFREQLFWFRFGGARDALSDLHKSWKIGVDASIEANSSKNLKYIDQKQIQTSFWHVNVTNVPKIIASKLNSSYFELKAAKQAGS